WHPGRRGGGGWTETRLQADRLRTASRYAALRIRGGLDGRRRRHGAGLHDRQWSYGRRVAGADIVHRRSSAGAGRGRDHEMALEETIMNGSPVAGVALKATKANGIDMRYAETGSGPLVLFCHGWPESWYSWRHQLTAVSAAGFRCIAPDMRGYGGTQSPEPIDQYTLLHMAGDMAELAKALGESRAVIVGHDLGAPVAWHAAP